VKKIIVIILLSLAGLNMYGQKHGVGIAGGYGGADGNPPNIHYKINYAYHISSRIAIKAGYLFYGSERKLSDQFYDRTGRKIIGISPKNTYDNPVYHLVNSNHYFIGTDVIVNKWDKSAISIVPMFFYYKKQYTEINAFTNDYVNNKLTDIARSRPFNSLNKIGAGVDLKYEYNVREDFSVMANVFMYPDFFVGYQIGTEFRL
jgi:hypothetical protein